MTSLELFRALILAMPDSVVADSVVEQFLTTAGSRLCPTAFGDKWAEASVWLAAHLLQRSGTIGGTVAGVSGTVSSLKTGDEAITFAASASSGGPAVDADLMTTHYGLQFIAIRDTRSAVAPTFLGIV